jgi:hypothetical protein
MVLFHRRALLASLPYEKRNEAKKQYKFAVANLGASTVLFFLAAFVCTYTYHEVVNPLIDQPVGLSGMSRLLANDTSNTSTPAKKAIGPPNFPNYWISPYVNGGVLVYIIGMVYTFMGLAVVCDEFFVPALEVMIEKFSISDDVAGATLMAVRIFCYVIQCCLKLHCLFILNLHFYIIFLTTIAISPSSHR